MCIDLNHDNQIHSACFSSTYTWNITEFIDIGNTQSKTHSVCVCVCFSLPLTCPNKDHFSLCRSCSLDFYSTKQEERGERQREDHCVDNKD